LKKKINRANGKKQLDLGKQTTLKVHAFKVGAQYYNRDGSYQVISITDPNMVIRYQDGRTLESPISLQARIWENMQEGNEGDIEVDAM
jgi:hypothetical protein